MQIFMNVGIVQKLYDSVLLVDVLEMDKMLREIAEIDNLHKS